MVDRKYMENEKKRKKIAGMAENLNKKTENEKALSKNYDKWKIIRGKWKEK